MEYFKQWCHLHLVQGAIDDTHIFISKPSYFQNIIFISNVRIFYSCSKVVDYKKRFVDFLVGFPCRLISELKCLAQI